MLRSCLRDPIQEIFEAARLLDAAVSAHLMGETGMADALIRLADMPAVTDWSNSLWGSGGPWSRPLTVDRPLPFFDKAERIKVRMPNKVEMAALIVRDGFRCRFCGIPLVRKETRTLIRRAYPDALRWGDANRNVDQHAAFQAMWLQYDHLVPHSRGGSNDLSNIIVTCAPCNYGRWHLTIEEVGLTDPTLRPPTKSEWDGLERFRL